MALGDVIGGRVEVTNGGSATVIPGAGERWAITFLRSGYASSGTRMPQSGYGPKFTIGVAASADDPPASQLQAGSSGLNATREGVNGPLFLDPTNYLALSGAHNNGQSYFVTYSGIKLN